MSKLFPGLVFLQKNTSNLVHDFIMASKNLQKLSKYLGVVFPPVVVGNRVSICISTQARSPVAQQIDKCPFFFEVSEPARKLFSGMHHASCSKEPGPDIGPA